MRCQWHFAARVRRGLVSSVAAPGGRGSNHDAVRVLRAGALRVVALARLSLLWVTRTFLLLKRTASH